MHARVYIREFVFDKEGASRVCTRACIGLAGLFGVISDRNYLLNVLGGWIFGEGYAQRRRDAVCGWYGNGFLF